MVLNASMRALNAMQNQLNVSLTPKTKKFSHRLKTASFHNTHTTIPNQNYFSVAHTAHFYTHVPAHAHVLMCRTCVFPAYLFLTHTFCKNYIGFCSSFSHDNF